MKHVIEQYHCDDYRLLVLMHELYEIKKPVRPWWHLGTSIFFIGAAILIGLAWYFE